MDTAMLDVLSAIDSKLTIIIYGLAALFAISVIRTLTMVLQRKKLTKSEKHLEIYNKLFRNKEYDQVMEITSSILEKDPTNVQILWLKAKTLYQTGQLSEAKDAYFEIMTMEPDWESDAKRYIDRIAEQIALQASNSE